MSGSGYESMAAKCPFYRESGRQIVKCEGFREGVFLSVSFESAAGKREFFRCACADVTKWEDCPVAGMLLKRWEP